MIATTFSWFPDIGWTANPKLTVSESQFGDGYSQRTPQGVNTTADVFSLTFTQPRTLATSILTFLRARKGSEAFNWTNPLNEAGVYVCKKFTYRVTERGLMEVTAEFQQVFES